MVLSEAATEIVLRELVRTGTGQNFPIHAGVKMLGSNEILLPTFKKREMIETVEFPSDQMHDDVETFASGKWNKREQSKLYGNWALFVAAVKVTSTVCPVGLNCAESKFGTGNSERYETTWKLFPVVNTA
jgi:hypothetical protein